MKYIHGLLLCIVSLTASPAPAGEVVPFAEDMFQGMATEGKPLLIEAHAEWCPICRKQATVIDKLVHSSAYAAVTVLRIDYDQQKDALKRFHIGTQGTLIGFKGTEERGRSVGETSDREISALFDAVIK